MAKRPSRFPFGQRPVFLFVFLVLSAQTASCPTISGAAKVVVVVVVVVVVIILAETHWRRALMCFTMPFSLSLSPSPLSRRRVAKTHALVRVRLIDLFQPRFFNIYIYIRRTKEKLLQRDELEIRARIPSSSKTANSIHALLSLSFTGLSSNSSIRPPSIRQSFDSGPAASPPSRFPRGQE